MAMPVVGAHQSPKRRRMVTSCSECYRRKQKVRPLGPVAVYEDDLPYDVHLV